VDKAKLRHYIEISDFRQIFSLIFSAILIRDIESINRFVIIWIIVSAVGAFGVTSGL